ncbi:MAG: hypothetical protein AAGG51_10845 [Cyanobacteria bacterium P01_G01_bin.54]
MGKGTVLRLVLLSGLGAGIGSGCLPLTVRLGLPQQAAQIQVEHAGLQVQISGTVVQRAPFVQGGAYQVQDHTGQVWVFTEEALPELEANVTVRGLIRSEELSLGQRAEYTEQAAYLQEIERR